MREATIKKVKLTHPTFGEVVRENIPFNVPESTQEAVNLLGGEDEFYNKVTFAAWEDAAKRSFGSAIRGVKLDDGATQELKDRTFKDTLEKAFKRALSAVPGIRAERSSERKETVAKLGELNDALAAGAAISQDEIRALLQRAMQALDK